MEFLTGLVLLIVTFGPSVWAGMEIARRCGRSGTGPAARGAAAFVVGLGVPVVVACILGAVGLFARLPVAVVAALIGVSLALWARLRFGDVSESRPGAEQTFANWAERDSSALPWWTVPAGGAMVALVVALWMVPTLHAIRFGGTNDFDSLNYHLVFAGGFVHSGWVTRLHPINYDPAATFNPANGELLDAIVMGCFRTDMLVPLINMVWLALFLLACWTIGARRGLAPLTLAAGALLLCTPLLIISNAGTAGTDVGALALFGVAFALLFEDPDDRRLRSLAGLAAGLAAGTKFTVVAGVVLLTIALMFLVKKAARRRALGGWIGWVVLGGAFWYLRNLFRTGSPVPSLRIGLGPFQLARPRFPLVDLYGNSTVAQYLGDPHQWHRTFVPGFRTLGQAWPFLSVLVAAAAVAALAVAVRRRSKSLAVVGGVGLGLAVAYVYTPVTAYGPKGAPSIVAFALNLRYSFPALTVILWGGVLAIGMLKRRWASMAFVGVAALIVATAMSKQSRPPLTNFGLASFLAGAVASTGVLMALVWRPIRLRVRRLASMRVLLSGGCTLIVLVAVIGAYASPHYVDRWYRSGPDRNMVQAIDVMRTARDARVGVLDISALYPLMGPHFDNEVAWIGPTLPHGGIGLIRSCAQLRQAVADAGLDFVVVSPSYVAQAGLAGTRLEQFAAPQAAEWLTSDPAAKEIVANPSIALVKLNERPDPKACGHPR